MTSHALTRRPQIAAVDSAAKRPAKRAPVEIGRVLVLDRHTLGALRAAQRLGVPMTCALDGVLLTIRRADP